MKGLIKCFQQFAGVRFIRREHSQIIFLYVYFYTISKPIYYNIFPINFNFILI